MMMNGGMTAMMALGALFGLLLLVALVAATWWLVRRVAPTRRDAALEILRERYARGDITREEFEARRKDLAA